MFADLHLHSIHSDGTDTPDELISLVIKHNVKIISITDHDSIAAYAYVAPEQYPDVKIIPAVEISAVFEHSYVHVLGYYIDIESDDLTEYIKNTSAEKTENTRVNFENAVKHGCFDYNWERVLELNREQLRITGVHVVAAMRADNVTLKDMRLWDMFNKYFWSGSPEFIPTEKATAYDAVDIIHKAGGVSVIAHPAGVKNDSLVNDLIGYGARGLEVYHPTHSKDDILRYARIAKTKKIMISGGTDWHGKNNISDNTRFGMCGLENDSYPILSY